AAVAVAWSVIDPAHALAVTIAVLVVSCPCALSLAIPAALGAASGSLHKQGVLITRGNAIEGLANATDIVFDKTGTLTTGQMHLRDAITLGTLDRNTVLAWAAALETGAAHPVARALQCAAGAIAPANAVLLQHVAGAGIEGEIDGRRVRIGSAAFVGELTRQPLPASVPSAADDCTVVMLGDANGWLAQIALADQVRGAASALIAALKDAGLRVHLVSGDRRRAHAFVATLTAQNIPAERLANDVYWPIHEMLVKLFKKDQLSRISYNYATRALRQIAHQGSATYTRIERSAGRILMFCGPTEGEELGAQIAVDLLDAAGYEVFFAGAGVANDEVLEELASTRAGTLVLWASAASDAPAIRALIDQIKEIGGHPNLRIVCGGGVFNRALGLAEEIGADVSATTPSALVTALTSLETAAVAGRTSATATATTTRRRSSKVA
ncbi:MAG: HAD-IC family P-type ATPase, partial [Planctomycetota bacterium]